MSPLTPPEPELTCKCPDRPTLTITVGQVREPIRYMDPATCTEPVIRERVTPAAAYAALAEEDTP